MEYLNLFSVPFRRVLTTYTRSYPKQPPLVNDVYTTVDRLASYLFFFQIQKLEQENQGLRQRMRTVGQQKT